MQISIHDVAKKSGVSLSTVSKAFDVQAKVAPATRERIRRVAAELGYHPSATARALVRGRTDTIGIILPPNHISPIHSPFYATMFHALLVAASAQKKDVTVRTGGQWATAAQSLPRFRDGRCDGFVAFWQSATSDIFDALLGANVPIVLVNDRLADPRLTWVDVDSTGSARSMTEYLLLLGHRRIGFIAGDQPISCVQPRREGYGDALRHHEIVVDERLALPGTFDVESIRSRIVRMMALPKSERPTALFCASDSLALNALRLLRGMNLRVPEDVSVAGHDDVPAAELEYPALTTMRQPFDRIAQVAVKLLIDQEDDPLMRGTKTSLPTELIIRSSTAPPP